MSQVGVNPHQCVKCGAPVGTGGGRCPFCGTEQPKLAATPGEAAVVGLTNVNRQRMGRPPLVNKEKSPLTAIAISGSVVLLAVAGGAIAWSVMRPPPPLPVASAPVVTATGSAPTTRTIAGIDVPDPAKVDPTDLLPKVRKRIAAWDPEPKLIDISVTRAKNGLVDLNEPGAEIVYRFLSDRPDTSAKANARERMQITLRNGPSEPEQGSAPATEKTGPEPTCVWSAAWRAATSTGLSAAGPVDARYGVPAKGGDPVWTLTAAGQPPVVLDGQRCAIKLVK
jgi:hypothetical protein